MILFLDDGRLWSPGGAVNGVAMGSWDRPGKCTSCDRPSIYTRACEITPTSTQCRTTRCFAVSARSSVSPDVRIVPACIRRLPERRVQLAAAQTAGLSPETGEAATAQLTPDTVGAANCQPGSGVPGRASGQLTPDTVVRPPARSTTVEPLAPARFKIQFTASAELRDKLERLQALMRTSVPDGDLATVIDIAVIREIERIEGKRFGKTKTPTTWSPSAAVATTVPRTWR